jgi:elongation of very long chain fatty acids protein 6
VTVLLFTWFCYTHENPGIIFVAMNYSVHAIMYGYYFMVRPPFPPPSLPPSLFSLLFIILKAIVPLRR